MSEPNRKFHCPALHRVHVVFFVQTFAALSLIAAALINLTVPGLCSNPEERNFWKVSLAGTIGYLFPSPSLAVSQGI